MRVTLRKCLPEDAEIRASFGYHPDVLRGMGVKLDVPASMSMSAAEAWVDRIEKHAYAWIIEHEGRLAGEIRIDNVNLEDRRATLAIAIVDPAKLGLGLGRFSIRTCLQKAFGDMELHRVSVRVLASNLRAIRCYEACGFRREGIEREAALTDWGREDDVMLGILAAEYRERLALAV